MRMGGYPDAFTWLRMVNKRAYRCLPHDCDLGKLAVCFVAFFAVLHFDVLHFAVLHFVVLPFAVF